MRLLGFGFDWAAILGILPCTPRSCQSHARYVSGHFIIIRLHKNLSALNQTLGIQVKLVFGTVHHMILAHNMKVGSRVSLDNG